VNVSLYIFHCLNAPKSLLDVESERSRFLQEMASYDQQFTWRLNNHSSLMIQQLTGQSQEKQDVGLDHESDHRWIKYQKLSVAFLLGDYQEAVLCSELNKDLFLAMESVDISAYFLFNGMAQICLFKQTRKKRRQRIGAAKSCLKDLSRLARIAPDYCLPKLRLLQACVSSVSPRKRHATRQDFLIAIALAQSSGSFCDEAVAREQFGRFLISTGKDSLILAGQNQLRLACTVYQRWGAHRKEDMLEKELNLIGGPST